MRKRKKCASTISLPSTPRKYICFHKCNICHQTQYEKHVCHFPIFEQIDIRSATNFNIIKVSSIELSIKSWMNCTSSFPPPPRGKFHAHTNIVYKSCLLKFHRLPSTNAAFNLTALSAIINTSILIMNDPD